MICVSSQESCKQAKMNLRNPKASGLDFLAAVPGVRISSSPFPPHLEDSCISQPFIPMVNLREISQEIQELLGGND